MENQDLDSKLVCHSCICDEYMAEQVRVKATPALCSYCNETRAAIALDCLSNRIHDAMQEHFELTPGYPSEPYEFFTASEGRWERRGDPVEYVIAELGGLDEDVASDVTSLLSGRHGYWAIREEGREDPYGLEAMYEEKEAFDLGFRLTWAEFRREVQANSRFFSPGAEKLLAEIFGDLTAFNTSLGGPVIRTIDPQEQDHSLWRGRLAQSPQAIEKILNSPAQELGPPPTKLAKAGRMNAQGISVFYGGTEQSTCVSELRPSVGSSIVIARFELLRPVRLLDLGALSKAYVSCSYFDPEYPVHKARSAFLSRLVSEISQPILPEDEALEYVPTQVVAEYLAHKADSQVDGIIYPSSQTGGSGENVVLFNRSSRVEPYDLPSGSPVEVEFPTKRQLDEDDDIYDGIWLSETVLSKTDDELSVEGDSPGRSRTLRRFMNYIFKGPKDDRDPTLRLDMESVEVLGVMAVSYDSTKRSVIRDRQTEEQRSAWEKRFAEIGVIGESEPDEIPDG